MAERFVIRNNKYAYAYVALKRTRWTEASEDLWRVFDRRAVHLVLRSDLTDRLLLMWCYASGALNVTLFTPFVWHSSQGDTLWIIISINAFLIGFASIATLSALLEGATDAVYIVFALRPQAISDLLIFHRLSRIAELYGKRIQTLLGMSGMILNKTNLLRLGENREEGGPFFGERSCPWSSVWMKDIMVKSFSPWRAC